MLLLPIERIIVFKCLPRGEFGDCHPLYNQKQKDFEDNNNLYHFVLRHTNRIPKINIKCELQIAH
jgi:hypothetical protein